MNPDIVNALDHVEAKKRTQNIETNLRGECSSIIELDRRVEALLDEIKTLHVDVEQRYGFLTTTCDKLTLPYRSLQRVELAIDLAIKLTKLNRLCRRISTNPILNSTVNYSALKKILENGNNNGENNEEIDKRLAIQIALALAEDFSAAYTPFEDILSRRTDLPYHSFANKVFSFRTAIFR